MQPEAADPNAVECLRLLRMLGDSVERVFEHLHPLWRRNSLWESAAVSTESLPRASLLAFGRLCGPLPRLPALQHPVAHWCLLPSDEMSQRLAVFALARRPGVVRGCLRRSDREALASTAGAAAGRLQGLAQAAFDRGESAAAMTRDHWAWTGYRDLSRDRAWPERCLKRWVRFAFPPRPAKAEPVAMGRLPLAEEIARVDNWLDTTGMGP